MKAKTSPWAQQIEELGNAAWEGNAAKVEELLQAGVPADGFSEIGRTALMVAATYGKVAVLDLLLQHGADPNLRDLGERRGRRPLETWEKRALLEHVDSRLGQTALAHAVSGWRNHDHIQVEVLQKLLAAGADPDIPDVNGKTPLIHSAWWSRTTAVPLLLAAGADLNHRDVFGYSVLMYAQSCVGGRTGDEGKEFLRVIRQAGPDEAGMVEVELCDAAGEGDLDRVQAAIERGAQVNFMDTSGHTPLHEAVGARRDHPGPALRIIELLLEKGADPNRRRWKEGTPLWEAMEGNDLDAVQLLLQHGADPSIQAYEEAPIDRAKLLKHLEIVEVLKKAGARGKSLKKERGLNYQEEEVAAVLVRQGIEEVSMALAEQGEVLRGIQGQEVTCGSGGLLVYQLVGHPWTVVETAADDFLEPELAADLSRSLDTAAIWIGASDAAGAFGYDLFEAGERTEWFYDGPGRQGKDGWERDFGSREKKRKPSKNAEPQEILHRFLRAQDAFYMGPQLGVADHAQTFFSGWSEQELVRADVVKA